MLFMYLLEFGIDCCCLWHLKVEILKRIDLINLINLIEFNFELIGVAYGTWRLRFLRDCSCPWKAMAAMRRMLHPDSWRLLMVTCWKIPSRRSTTLLLCTYSRSIVCHSSQTVVVKLNSIIID